MAQCWQSCLVSICNLRLYHFLLLLFPFKKMINEDGSVTLYIYIFMTHHKSLILILWTCKYATSSHVISSLSTKKYFWKFKEHVISSFSIEKLILKIQENHFMPCHLSPLKNNSKNLSSMTHHLMTCHLFVNSLNIQVCNIISCHITFLHWKILLKI
jgi:hypothetical protein